MSHMQDRYAYLGPEGTFTEAALHTLAEAAEIETTPYPTVQATLEAVRSGEAGRAVVPIENSVEGAVTATLDELAAGHDLVICAEILLQVTFALLGRPGTHGRDAVRRRGAQARAHARENRCRPHVTCGVSRRRSSGCPRGDPDRVRRPRRQPHPA